MNNGCGCLISVFLIGLFALLVKFFDLNPVWLFCIVVTLLLFSMIEQIHSHNSLFGYKLGLSKQHKTITSFLLVILMFAIIAVGGMVDYVAQKQENAKMETAAKAIYEEIKADYEQGNYDKIADEFKKMKDYKKTSYAELANKDFGDYKDKMKAEKEAVEEAERQEKQARAEAEREQRIAKNREGMQEKIDAYVMALLDEGSQGRAMIEYANTDCDRRITVFVNDWWFSISQDRQQGFIKQWKALWIMNQVGYGSSVEEVNDNLSKVNNKVLEEQIERWNLEVCHADSKRKLAECSGTRVYFQ